ncbi:hypothetical protein [Ekhidna sp.]|uniref:hypothetical protein n=1 Tax=Ekhidna sp. TaxID=2608089 RepID=UPI003BACB085
MIRARIRKYLRLLEYFFYLGRIDRTVTPHSVQNVGVLVAINPQSNKFKNWHDGFTEAIKRLKADFKVTLIFFQEQDSSKLLKELNEHDFIIVKSAWRTSMDYFLRKNSKQINPYLGLMISASNHRPKEDEQVFYDVVWFETEWYRKRSVRHSKAFHAFGIDREVMIPTPENTHKTYDYIVVGAPRTYKRLGKLLAKNGNRLLIGDLKNRDRKSEGLLTKLRSDGVIVEDFQGYEKLASKYHVSRICYVPCKVHGGGERSLLEARSCGLAVEIEEDNPKLQELLTSPIWDADYYSAQLKKGIESVKK